MSSEGKADIDIVPEFAEGIGGQNGYGVRLLIRNRGDEPAIIKEWGIVTPDRKYVNFLEWDSVSIDAQSEHEFTRPPGGFQATIQLMVKNGRSKKIRFYVKDAGGKYHYVKYGTYEEFLKLNE